MISFVGRQHKRHPHRLGLYVHFLCKCVCVCKKNFSTTQNIKHKTKTIEERKFNLVCVLVYTTGTHALRFSIPIIMFVVSLIVLKHKWTQFHLVPIFFLLQNRNKNKTFKLFWGFHFWKLCEFVCKTCYINYPRFFNENKTICHQLQMD